MKNKKIVVLMGGPSAEREVSLNTGKAILNALLEKGYRAVGMDFDPGRAFEQLKESKCDIVFNAIHGKYGEDGYLQAALEMLDIAYTGSGVLSSAISMDKVISKRMFISERIPTPRARFYIKSDQSRDLAAEIKTEFDLPVVIKPAAQGSSIGVEIVEAENLVRPALEKAFQSSDDILVEQFIKGRELTVAVWGDEAPEALPIIEIVPHSGKYDYQSKYTKGASDYIVPAKLDDAAADSVRQAALKAFRVLGCSGVARVDVMLGEDQVPYVLEVNTVPGMTATSLVPKAAGAVGISFPDLCEKLLTMAKKR